MVTGNRRAGEIVVPGVGREIVILVVLVSCAVPGISTALGHYLHLCASRAVEICSLIGSVDLKLFNAIDRSWHHAACSAPYRIVDNAAAWIAAKATRVNGHTAVHVTAVVASVKHERALIHHRARHTTIRAHARLQRNERGDVTVKTRE